MQNEKLIGPELKAAAVALRRFQADEAGSDLANFGLIIREDPDGFEVVLYPRPISDRTYPRGGKTEYGREVHYAIKKDTFEISRISFAR